MTFSSYAELLDTIGYSQLEGATKEKIRTLEDKLANALNSTKVSKDERQTDNIEDNNNYDR